MSYSIKEILKQRAVPFVLIDLTIGQSNPLKLQTGNHRAAGVYNPNLTLLNQNHISWGVEHAPKCYLAPNWWLVGIDVTAEDGMVFPSYNPHAIGYFVKKRKSYLKISKDCALFSKVISISDLRSATPIGRNLSLDGLIFDLDKMRLPFALESGKFQARLEDEIVQRLKEFSAISEIPWTITGKRFSDELDEITATGPLHWMTQGDLMGRGIAAICNEQDLFLS